MYRQKLGLLIFVLSALLVNECVAGNKITVVTESWKPYNYLANGKVVGQSTEVVESILQLTDIAYDISLYPWARSYSMALKYPNILIYSIVRSPARSKKFHWFCPIGEQVFYHVYTLSSREDITVDNLDTLRKYSIGVTRDTFPHEFLKARGFEEDVNFQVTATNKTNLIKLLNNRVDIIIEANDVVYQRLIEAGFANSHIKSTLPLKDHVLEHCMAMSLSTPQHIVDKVRVAHQQYLSLSRSKQPESVNTAQ